jgi:hypothetical protein
MQQIVGCSILLMVRIAMGEMKARALRKSEK